MEKISFSTINCESDRRKRREGSTKGCGLREEKERGERQKCAWQVERCEVKNEYLLQTFLN